MKNHALIDGNERLGWLATAICLQVNGIDVTRISNDDAFDLVMVVTSEPIEVHAIASRHEGFAGDQRG